MFREKTPNISEHIKNLYFKGKKQGRDCLKLHKIIKGSTLGIIYLGRTQNFLKITISYPLTRTRPYAY